jgi:hypothetical protein
MTAVDDMVRAIRLAVTAMVVVVGAGLALSATLFVVNMVRRVIGR